MMWIAVHERTARDRPAARPRRCAGQVSAALPRRGGRRSPPSAASPACCPASASGRPLRLAVPGLPVETPLAFVAAALLVATATGLAAGVLPAHRAAALDPIEALQAE